MILRLRYISMHGLHHRLHTVYYIGSKPACSRRGGGGGGMATRRVG